MVPVRVQRLEGAGWEAGEVGAGRGPGEAWTWPA